MVKPRHFLLLTILLLCSCKGGSPLGAVVLKDAPPPELPQGWVSTPEEFTGFSLLLPPGWQLGPMPKAEFEKFVKLLNDNAWDMLGQSKAEVNFETAVPVYGQRRASNMDPTAGIHMEDQFLVAIREDLGKSMTLKAAADRWRDTIRLEGEQNPPVEGSVELPVGKAITLTKSNLTLGIIDKVTVYILVDGNVAYTFYFNETASKSAEPIPTKAIMDTFRVKR